jgi:SnoaL-like domain
MDRARLSSCTGFPLDAHSEFVVALRELYAADVRWSAPGRGIEHRGREEVIAHLLREAGGMRDPEFTCLRRSGNERQLIDEFAVRFVYTGAGLERAPIDAGDFVELKRVRILELTDGKVCGETCIENWSILLSHAGPRPWPPAAATG